VATANRGEAEAEPMLRGLAASLLAAGAAYTPPRIADDRIVRALTVLSQQPDIGVAQVARQVGLSPARFRHCFRAQVGQAPKPWLQALRLTRAAHQLRTTTAAVQEVAAEWGFANDHQFHRAFKRFHGCTPSDWRRRGQGL
jgi:AraC-like DNA-binding protein